MAVKFSQFSIGTASATAYVVGYDGSSNVKIPATSLVPSSRTITINGVSYDLSANRSWTISTGPTGSGTTNYVTKWTGSTALGNSLIFDNGTSVGIGTASPSYKLDVIGDIRSSTGTYLTSATAGTAQGFANNGIGLVTFGLNTSGNALVVNDIDGAKFAFSTGGFNTTFYKHRSTDAKYYPTFVIKGSGATSYGTGFDFYVGTSVAATITSNGRLLLGTTTESTYLLDVNGTARVKEYLYLLRSDAAATIAALTYQAGNTIDIGTTFRVIGTNQWNNTTSSTSYIQNGYTTKNFVSTPQQNGSFSSFDFSNSGAFAPTIPNPYTQKLINGAMTIVSTAATNNFHGISISATDNSASIANNVYGVYADATLGTNTSANRWAGYFVGNGYFSGNVGIGTTSPSSKLHVVTGNVDGIRVESSNSGYIELGKTGSNRWRWANDYTSAGRFELQYGNNTTPTTTRFTITSDGNADFSSSASSGYGLYTNRTIGSGLGAQFAISSGNVLIGTTTDAGYKLDVQGTFRSNHNGYGIVLTSTTGNRLQWIDNGTFRWAIGSQSIQGGELANSFNFYSATNSSTQVSIASDGAVMIGVPYPISSNYAPSAQLQVASTTKGFLPPRMTGAQAELIGTPAAGLLVYANNGNGATITSTGWWGYNGTTWVKLN